MHAELLWKILHVKNLFDFVIDVLFKLKNVKLTTHSLLSGVIEL